MMKLSGVLPLRFGELRPALQALSAEQVNVAGMRLPVPGSLPIRLSVVLGNLRMQRLFDALIRPGHTVIDVGANIGYNTCYAAHRTGSAGRVYAIEPAQDNLTVLYGALFANRLSNVVVLPYAAGSRRAVQKFYLRGDVSAVNSLFQNNFYAPVTAISEVLIAPLDELIPTVPDLVKIDVEGAELDVLHGMAGMLKSPTLRLVVEWHPELQVEAGHAADALPRYLLDLGFELYAVTHIRRAHLRAADVPAWTARLLASRSPVELVACR